MNELGSLVARLVGALDASGIPFMVAGSFASTAHGAPRATQDLDVVIDPPDAKALSAFLDALPGEAYYVDHDAAREALRGRGMFNVIDFATGWKIDLIVRKDRPFSAMEFARRSPTTLLGVPVFIASAEDTVIAKLEWSKIGGGSARQRRDVAGVLATVGEALDRAYVARWVQALGLEAEWQKAAAPGTADE